MAKLYGQVVPPADLNKNTEWFMYPGVWTTYILILFFSWILVLSVFSCTPGTITYHFFHWKKGTPFSDDQGIYNSLTWWEQMDNGRQLTRNRKFLTVVPVVLKSLFDIGFGFAGDVELDCYGKALFMVTISDQPGQCSIYGRWLLCHLGNQDSNYTNIVDEGLMHWIQREEQGGRLHQYLLPFPLGNQDGGGTCNNV